MSLDPALHARIQGLVTSQRVVLFMKGTRQSPRCGFSAAAVGALDAVVDDYLTVDVLADEDVRQGIKAYGNWPTIPQLYIDGDLVGGSDIIQQMLNTGDLHRALGLEPRPASRRGSRSRRPRRRPSARRCRRAATRCCISRSTVRSGRSSC